MTAEIAVMNREAIALAADSAVTLHGEKVFFSANKIFSLSGYEPVAAMIYGNYGLMGVPWEPVLKSFRSDLGHTKLKTIAAYTRELLQFVKVHRGFYSAALCDMACRNHIFELFRFLYKEMVEHRHLRTPSSTGKISKGSLIPESQDVNEVIDFAIDFWQKAKPLDGISRKKISRLRRKYGKFITSTIDELFRAVSSLSQKRRQQLYAIGLQALFKCPEGFSWPSLTGLIVAGFGDNELFPALTHCSLHGIFDGHLHHRIDAEERIGHAGAGALIFPFAQTQMISAFMEGVDPGYEEVIEKETANLIKRYPQKVIDRCGFLPKIIKARVAKEFAKVQARVTREFVDGLDEYRNSEFVDATLGLIAMVPKGELPILAESLVNLTSLRRKISLDSDTVGGPVDVALISKGDGLIWIKRKHYFEPTLNRQYFHNVYGDKE